MLKMKVEYGYLSLMCESNKRKDKFQFEKPSREAMEFIYRHCYLASNVLLQIGSRKRL